jgi:hypothetical protein
MLVGSTKNCVWNAPSDDTIPNSHCTANDAATHANRT